MPAQGEKMGVLFPLRALYELCILNRYIMHEQNETLPYIPYKTGDDVEGVVVATGPSEVFIDLSPYGTGIIFGREYISIRDMLKKLKKGDAVSAKVLSPETDNGYIALSLKEARKIQLWKDAVEGEKNDVTYNVLVKKANRGGLVVDWFGINGFVPFSLLTTNEQSHGESSETDTNKLIGKKIWVSILEVDPEEERLIFSETLSSENENAMEENKSGDTAPIEREQQFEVGDTCSGVITCVVDFGAFIRLGSNVEALIHTSEIDWGFVSSPSSFFSVGDTVRCKIIDITDGKYSCSVKALKENPWANIGERYTIGDIVPGVIIQYNKHGVFISIEVGISGLMHKSNFENEEDLQNRYRIGNSYNFKIARLDAKSKKIIFVPEDMSIDEEHPPLA